MPPPYTGRELVSALIDMGYYPADRTGSHVKLRYVHPETDETRNVTIPMGGEVGRDTLRNIANQCGAKDFDSWCDWIDDLLS